MPYATQLKQGDRILVETNRGTPSQSAPTEEFVATVDSVEGPIKGDFALFYLVKCHLEERWTGAAVEETVLGFRSDELVRTE